MTKADWRGPITVVTGLLLALPFASGCMALMWFAPILPNIRRGDPDAVMWIGILVLNVGVAVGLVGGWFMRYRTYRWWPWPVTAVVLSLAAVPLYEAIG